MDPFRDETVEPTVVDSPLQRPVFVLGPPGGDHAAVARSLLTAPGSWDAGTDFGDLRSAADVETVRSALLQRHPGEDGADASLTRMVGSVAAGVPVSMLDEAFPGALYVYVHQDPSETLQAAHHNGANLLDAVATWREVVTTILADLTAVPAERWCVTDRAELVREPDNEVQRLLAFLGLGWHPVASQPWRELGLAPSPSAATSEVEAYAVALAPLAERLRALVVPAEPSLKPQTPPGSLSATDDGLAPLLKRCDASLLVSTYQTNRLIVLRNDQGVLGVHLRAFDRPMGIATTPDGFALGLRTEVLDFRDFPAAAANVEPHGRHDACFMPRNSHVTGDIAVHDLVLGRDGLWLVATNFNCLATLDTTHSFVPRWRPSFVTALVAEDRCHLNGLALVDGVPRFVTALGVSDTAGGWRAGKASGGVIIDVRSGEVVVEGLSMPHSPRWHEGRLYVLESGRGRLLVCDLASGTTATVTELPGFTRGLSFHGRTAFVGTSQIRETATFGDLPISELARRECGVWAVDLVTGAVVGSVRFEDRVQEIFDVAVLPGVRFPEVAEQGSDLVKTSWYVPAGP